jgi:hypothetical protein
LPCDHSRGPDTNQTNPPEATSVAGAGDRHLLAREESTQWLANRLEREVGLRPAAGTLAQLTAPSLIVQDTPERQRQCCCIAAWHDEPARGLAALEDIGTPGASAATTSKPQAIAARGATGKPSWREGKA